MARRKELGSIASGVIGSFSSRNNDDLGYWGIGKLCGFAQNNGAECVRIDLLNKEIVPKTNNFDLMTDTYLSMFYTQCEHRGINKDWVSKVVITICFNQEYDKNLHYFRSSHGNPYVCTLKIEDDLGREHKAKDGGWCAPHNPSKESKSTRVYDF